MSTDNNENSVKMPSSYNCNPYISLTRLTEEDIKRFTGMNQNKKSLLNTHSQNVKIKQEYQNTNQENMNINNQNMIENIMWQSQECTTVIKVETTTTTIREIKTEPIEVYQVTIENQNHIKCDICYKDFDDFEDFLIHKSFSHRPKPYICEMCDARFSLSIHLDLHLADHVKDFCIKRRESTHPIDIQSSSKSNLALNYNNCKSLTYLPDSLNIVPKNIPQQINSKGKKSQKKTASILTQKYYASNSSVKAFKCPNCLFSSSSEKKFLNHHKVCNDNFDNNLLPENNSFQCHLCVKSYLNQSSLNGHMKYHSVRGEIVSRRNYKNKNNKFNSNVHPKLSVHKCKKCNQNFISRSKLNIHLKQHKKKINKCHKQYFVVKPFTNPTKCKSSTKKITTNKKQRNNSMKMKKTFNCVHCNKYYKTKKSLAEHKRRYHPENKTKIIKLTSVKCNWCSAVITKGNLIRHIKSFHPNVKPVKCIHCSIKFKDWTSMRYHVKNVHTK